MAANRKHDKEYYNVEKDADAMLDLLISADVSDFESSDCDEDECDISVPIPQPVRPGANIVTRNQEEEEQENSDVDEEDQQGTHQQASNPEQCTIPPNWLFTEKNNIKWRRKPFTPMNLINPEIFNSTEQSVNESTPIEYFSKYISEESIENMVEKTNMYSLQKGSIFRYTNVTEITSFLGLHIMMGCLKYPRARMYWDSALHIDLFVEAMSRERFFELRSNFHVVDNLAMPENCKDKFYKVRPLYDCIRRRCLELQIENDLCVDEQIVPFKGHLGVKQYCKGKPNPWGIKLFLLCGKSGLCYDFIIRRDLIGHFPEFHNQKEASRCKMLGCMNKTHVFCEKCKVHLCFVKGRNCFKNFHADGN